MTGSSADADAASAAVPRRRYRLVSAVHHDGQRHRAGDDLDLAASDGDRLIAIGAARLAEPGGREEIAS